VEAAATVKGARIWLIAPDWQVRALVRAQLLEEGYDVTAVEDWAALEALLGAEEVVPPRLVIAELTGDEPPAALALLCAFPARRLVLRGAGAPAADTLRAAGIDAVLSRPSTIGDIVLAARALLAGANPREPNRTPVTE
jgi:CheY-like chemotaxis protein